MYHSNIKVSCRRTLDSFINTCIRLSLIGYQGEMEEMLKLPLSTRSTPLETCCAKTFFSWAKLFSISYGVSEWRSRTNKHEMGYVMNSQDTNDQLDALAKLHLQKLGRQSYSLKNKKNSVLILIWMYLQSSFSLYPKNVVKALSAINEHMDKWTFWVQ